MSGIREEEEKKILNPNEEERRQVGAKQHFLHVCMRVYSCVCYDRMKIEINVEATSLLYRSDCASQRSLCTCASVCVLGMYYTRMLCACIMSNNHPYIRRYLYLQRKLRINHTDTHLKTTIV